MAVEAITQIQEENKDSRVISGFKLRDLSIKTALVIPDNDDGIEVVINMRKIGSEDGLVWYGFSVKSVDQDNWLEHSAGKIATLTHYSIFPTLFLKIRRKTNDCF